MVLEYASDGAKFLIGAVAVSHKYTDPSENTSLCEVCILDNLAPPKCPAVKCLAVCYGSLPSICVAITRTLSPAIKPTSTALYLFKNTSNMHANMSPVYVSMVPQHMPRLQGYMHVDCRGRHRTLTDAS